MTGEVLGEVLVWPDGNLFLFSGAHRVFEFATGQAQPRAGSVLTFASNIEARRRYCTDRGVAFQHIVFPDKQTSLIPEYGGRPLLSLGRMYREQLGDVFTLPVEDYQARTDAFLRTDTHWSGRGQLLAMAAVLRAFGWPDEDLSGLLAKEEGKIVSVGHVCGDLGRKLEPKQGEERFRYQVTERVVVATNKLDAGNDGYMKLAFNPDAEDRRLLIYGDSFAQIAVEPLTAVFRLVLFLRTRFFHPEFVEQMQPTHVLTTNVERYLSQVDSDDRRPAFFMMPLLRGRSVSGDVHFAKLCSAILSYGREPYRRMFG
jgi:hypothetical protein